MAHAARLKFKIDEATILFNHEISKITQDISTNPSVTALFFIFIKRLHSHEEYSRAVDFITIHMGKLLGNNAFFDSRFPNGQLAEIFLSNNKSGSDSDTAAKDSAVVCSIALQFGVPLDVIRKALMRDSRDRPSGPLGCALDILAIEVR
ncbi:MAG: hypothetical protein WCD13_13225 [Pseudolabrys sp.]